MRVLGMRVLAALASAQLVGALSTSTEDFRAGISRGFPSRRAAGAPVVVADDAAASETSQTDDIVRESGSWHLQIDEDWAGLRRVSDAPRVYYVEGLLSAAECDALIAKATPARWSLQASSNWRSSAGMPAPGLAMIDGIIDNMTATTSRRAADEQRASAESGAQTSSGAGLRLELGLGSRRSVQRIIH